MSAIVDARDVLDPNARSICRFRGRITGHYERQGPNAWDPYRFVRHDGGLLEVHAGIELQLEDYGPRFRMRHDGKVVRVEWCPDANAQLTSDSPPEQLRQAFVRSCVKPFAEAPGMGAAAVIADKLDD